MFGGRSINPAHKYGALGTPASERRQFDLTAAFRWSWAVIVCDTTRRTCPLKPTPGLNGPPPHILGHPAVRDSCAPDLTHAFRGQIIDEVFQRPRRAKYVEFRCRRAACDCFQKRWTALPPVRQNPPPKSKRSRDRRMARHAQRANERSRKITVSAARSRGATTSSGPRSPSMIHPSFATSRSCAHAHSFRGVARRPGCQKTISSSTTGRPVISPRRFARVDLPDAPRPRITTRFILRIVRQTYFRVGSSPRLEALAGNLIFDRCARLELRGRPTRPGKLAH